MRVKKRVLVGAVVLVLPLSVLALPRRWRMDGCFEIRAGSYGKPPELSWSLDEDAILGPIRFMSARVVRHEPGLLRGIALQVARDRDGDGLLEPEEWETRASAKAESTPEGDVAQTPTVLLLWPYDGWALFLDDASFGRQRQQVWAFHGKTDAEWPGAVADSGRR